VSRPFPSLLSLFSTPVFIFQNFFLSDVREHNVLLVVTVTEAGKCTDIQYLRKTDVKDHFQDTGVNVRVILK
jgi:hypothetical protein